MTRLGSRDIEIEMAEAMLGVSFRNRALLEASLTHRSTVRPAAAVSYERLEFLGDAVVGAVVSEFLYKHLPNLSEGDLSARRAAIVSRTSLADAGRRAGVNQLPTVSRLLETLGERAETSLLADILEALVGAVFLDRGYRTARCVTNRLLDTAYRTILQDITPQDPKSLLQQRTQALWKELPAYHVERAAGADHRPVFRATVWVHGAVCGIGEGRSKKEAEREAAAQALLAMDEIGGERNGPTS